LSTDILISYAEYLYRTLQLGAVIAIFEDSFQVAYRKKIERPDPERVGLALPLGAGAPPASEAGANHCVGGCQAALRRTPNGGQNGCEEKEL